MVHSDDDGLRLPPRVAPQHVVIIPMMPKPEQAEQVLAYCNEVADEIRAHTYDGTPIRVKIDDRDIKPVEKKWQWVKRGVPVRLEIGPRDIESGSVFMGRRDKGLKEATGVPRDQAPDVIAKALVEIHQNLFDQAKAILDENIRRDFADFDQFTDYFTPKSADKPEIHGGFAWVKWCDSAACEEKAAEMKVTIRCLPFEQSGTEGTCAICGGAATTDAVFAKAY